MKRKTLATLLLSVLAVSSGVVSYLSVTQAGEIAKRQALNAEVLRLQSEVQTQMIQIDTQTKAKDTEQVKVKEPEKAPVPKEIVVVEPLPTVPQAYRQFVLDASKESGVAPEIIAALGEQETGWDCTKQGSAGDTGCLQILPDTGAWAMREMGFSGSLWNPQTNIRVGAWVLATFTRMEGGDVARGLAAYNAGPNGWDRAPVVARSYARRVLDRVVVSPEILN